MVARVALWPKANSSSEWTNGGAGMGMTHEQEMRQKEMEAAAAHYGAACARFLESLNATDKELEAAAELVAEQMRDNDGNFSEMCWWDGLVAECINDERDGEYPA